MFSLIMAAIDDDWSVEANIPTAASFSLSRFLEYTDPNIGSRFMPISDSKLDLLSQIPVVFMSELQFREDDGEAYIRIRIGRVLSARVEKGDIKYSFIIEKNLGPVFIESQITFRSAFNMERFELHRTHWAIKDSDLSVALRAVGLDAGEPQEDVAAIRTPLPEPSEDSSPVINSVQEFMDQVMQLDNSAGNEIFYRGHSNKNYKLEPFLYRRDENGGYRYLLKEETLVRDLLTACAPEFSSDQYMIDQLVRMQHYGLPTRLLDVTSNPLVALYFSCSDEIAENSGDGVDGEVVILTTPTSEVLFFDSDKISCISNLSLLTDKEKNKLDTRIDKEKFNETNECKKLINFIRREKPYFAAQIEPHDLERILFVRGRNMNARIQAQSGAFLIFGKDAILEETGHSTLNVRRIIVRNKKHILMQLDRLNIKSSTIYPGIEKAAAEIARKHELRPSNEAPLA